MTRGGLGVFRQAPRAPVARRVITQSARRYAAQRAMRRSIARISSIYYTRQWRRHTELKHLPATGHPHQVSTNTFAEDRFQAGGTPVQLFEDRVDPLLATGSTENTRVGDKIFTERLDLEFWAQKNGSATATTCMRIVVVRWSFNAPGPYTTVFTEPTQKFSMIQGNTGIAYPGHVMMDRTFTFDPTATSVMANNKHWKFSVPFRRTVRYDANTDQPANIRDATYVYGFLYNPGDPTSFATASADENPLFCWRATLWFRDP